MQKIDIFTYIRENWKVLTRTHRQLAEAAIDPKFQSKVDEKWIVYLPAHENIEKIREQLAKEMSPQNFEKIQLTPLPEKQNNDLPPGLLYLPRPYIVPGGRFNEMYGWDSYFIQLGLLRDGLIDQARDLTENCLYEIRKYGKILNANRSYYLTRSQPLFLTEMILGIYAQTKDRAWLDATLPEIESYYHFWMTEPHLTPATGLSRYYDFGEGAAQEVLSGERDAQGRSHYDLIQDYFRTHQVEDFDLAQYYDRKTDTLSALFYKGDRSMRESGFDPSNRFGPFNIDIIHYNPVCLNSLLYRMEMETAEIFEILNRTTEATPWRERAEKRKRQINSLLWDKEQGLYADYNFVTKRLRNYPYLTTFYPLWAGLATHDQAARLVKNLALFECDGGLMTSTTTSGNQWDAPFGWAPLELLAIQGLRRYGYNEEADRLSIKWLSLIHREYQQHGTIVEKYDVVNSRSQISEQIKFGYHTNEIGFGWTNASFTVLYDALPVGMQISLFQLVD